jgi:hypothetical protein
VLVVGDSTGVVLGAGLTDWVYRTHPAMRLSLVASGACGLVRDGRYQLETFNAALFMGCAEMFEHKIPDALAHLHPDVVLISITLADTWDRSFDGGATWLRPTDPVFAAHIQTAYDAFFASLAAAHVPHVVWLRPPVSSYATDGTHPKEDPGFTDGSQALVQAAVERQQARFGSMVSVLDFRSWFEASPLSTDRNARPDGTHLAPKAAAQVAEQWLGPQLLALAP